MYMRFPHLLTFRTHSCPDCTCGFRISSFSARTLARIVPAVSALRLFPQVRAPGLYVCFPHLLAFRRYSCPDCTCGSRPSPLSAGVFARVVPAVSASPRFPHALLSRLYMRFPPFASFRRCIRSGCTCGFRISSLSAGTRARVVRAVSALHLFPQVLPLGWYVRFSPFASFRRCIRSGYTCGFRISSLSAGILARIVPAVSASPRFPQVLLPGLYLRFLHLLAFRRYSCPDCTCGFRPSPLSAGAPSRMVRAVFALRLFPQVYSLGLYLRFPHLLAFRRYPCPDCACGFRISSLSAGTLARVVPAFSASPHFPHALLPGLYVRFPLFATLTLTFYSVPGIPLSNFILHTCIICAILVLSSIKYGKQVYSGESSVRKRRRCTAVITTAYLSGKRTEHRKVHVPILFGRNQSTTQPQ